MTLEKVNTTFYRVDPRMIPPVSLAVAAGVILLILEGPTAHGLLVLVILAPFFYLGLEILARKVLLDPHGVTISKLLRTLRMDWNDIEFLDAVRTGRKVFLILHTADGSPTFLTNTLSPFTDLVAEMLRRIPRDRVSENARQLCNDLPTKHGPLIQSWIVCLVLTGLVAGKILGYA